jgi:hypothetical protein
MALPASGPLSIQQINAEFGRGNNLNAYRGTTWYTDAGGSGTFSTGALSMSDFYGKRATSPTFSFSISQHIDRANLRSLAVAAGWNQSSPVQATLTGGYWFYSSTTGQAALTIDGSWPNGVTFVNNGYVVGMGGNGGNSALPAAAGGAGGTALGLGAYVTIYNYGYIAGGGGGGGGGNQGVIYAATASGGGGGGGRTGLANSAGGAASPATAGTLGTNGGSGTSGSFGYGGTYGANGTLTGGAGGNGGEWGSAGNAGNGAANAAGTGGAGGAAGYCTSGNGYITWAVAGNRYGPLG